MKELIKGIHKFRTFNKLKSVYRKNSVANRKESSAEHSWSCLLLADFFLSKLDLNFDEKREYLVKKGEDKNLPKNKARNFDNLFKNFTEPFMDENNADQYIKGTIAKRNNSKAVYVVKNNNRELYWGVLWNDPDVEMISNMDY